MFLDGHIWIDRLLTKYVLVERVSTETLLTRTYLIKNGLTEIV